MHSPPHPDTSQTERNCVLCFLKSPQPGTVKTRLGSVIGHQLATDLYRCFVQDLLITLQQLSIAPLIFYTPPHKGQDIVSWLGPRYRYYPQQGQDLGDRMAHAFQQAFQMGYRQVVIIGSDSPDLPVNYIQAAWNALANNEVVLGPSQDGGYYLLGFTPTNFVPEVFDGICWSTETVYPHTLQILHRSRRQIHELPPWYDVDTLDDLRQFYRRNHRTKLHSSSLQCVTQHWRELFDSSPT